MVPMETEDAIAGGNVNELETITNEVIEELNVEFDSFSEFPKEIDGCSCYFSETPEDFKNGNYVFVDDFGMENAFMRLNGEEINFKLIDSKFDDDVSINNYISEDYLLELSFKETGQIDETFQQEVQMKLAFPTGAFLTKTIYGECGC